MCNPKKSLICVLAIRTAIPLVKPITMGRGMNFTAVPMPVTPRIMSSNAGHHGAHEQSVHAVHRDNSRDHHYKRARRTADLGLRTA